MQEQVTLTIDGRQITVPANTLLVEAAAQMGILIPVYCYHPKLAPVGACRMCLVEVEGAPKLIASCTTPVREGMVVHTNNSRVEKARQGMLEFLLIHHPLDCPVCDKGGECPLQDFTYEFGPSRSRFKYPKRHWDKPLQIGQNILLDRERCIMCFRCVRFCEEISDHKELGVYRRGNNQMIGVAPGKPFNSQFSGNTIELCPVGALTGAPTRFFGRTWEVAHTPSVCSTCSAGCNMRVDTRLLNEVVRLWSRENRNTDDGWLCDKGRFNYRFVNENRLVDCKIRHTDGLQDASWPMATVKACGILEKYSKDSLLGVLVSPRMTNEDLYAISRFTRDYLNTGNIDHRSYYVHPRTANLYEQVARAGFSAGSLPDINGAQQIITIGVDISKEQPVTDLRIKKAINQSGAKLVVINADQTELGKYAEANVIYEPGQEADAIRKVAFAVKSNSDGDDAVARAGKLLTKNASKVVIIGERLARSASADSTMEALRELADALPQNTPCIVVVPHCNSRGAQILGVIPSEGARSGEAILEAAKTGDVKALWIVGEEPLLEADADLVRAALANVEAVVYMGWSLPEALPNPDVALPVVTFAEHNGTFTNADGRVQRIFKAIRPAGRSRACWEIVADLSQGFGERYAWTSVEQVFEEISDRVDAFSPLQWGKLGTTGVLLDVGVAGARSV